jgi:uncharacterized membrane protein
MPSMIVLASVALAAALIEAEYFVSDQWLAQWPRLFGAAAEGARGMMSTIAGSMMTVVGVTFSMVLMVLAMASSQYTSRILRNFIRSRVTQIVLGIFSGVFTYCLIVLRTIRSGGDDAFVPNLAVSFGFAMALGGVGALIFFIHHIATSIQASNIIALVADETISAMICRQWESSMLEKTSAVSAVDTNPLVEAANALCTGVKTLQAGNERLSPYLVQFPSQESTT